MPVRKRKQKGLRVSNSAFSLAMFKRHYGSEGVKSVFGCILTLTRLERRGYANMVLGIDHSANRLDVTSVYSQKEFSLLHVYGPIDDNKPCENALPKSKSISARLQCMLRKGLFILLNVYRPTGDDNFYPGLGECTTEN